MAWVVTQTTNADTYFAVAVLIATAAGILVRLPARLPLVLGLAILAVNGIFLVAGSYPAQWLGDVAFSLIFAGVVMAVFEPERRSADVLHGREPSGGRST